MSHSILVRETSHSKAAAPALLAYDITGRREAEAIIRSIATSFPDHGTDPDTGIYWFHLHGRTYDIFSAPY